MSLPVSAQLILSGVVFVVTYAAFVLRGRLPGRPPLWAVFVLGGLAMVVVGVEPPMDAVESIDLRVIAFLFSMFVITSGLFLSGGLDRLSGWIVQHSPNPRRLILMTSLGFGLASSVLMNDTMALLGTPILIATARRLGIKAKPLLLTLAFSITAGSAMTPIGNPQNMLISIQSGIGAPFLSFLLYLAPSTIMNLALTAGFVYLMYRRDLKGNVNPTPGTPSPVDVPLSRLSIGALVLAIGGMVSVNLLSLAGIVLSVGISEITLLAAVALLISSGRRVELIRRVDWGVLAMFAGLFVFTRGIYDGGVITLISPSFQSFTGASLLSFIMLSSVALSQVISNVPLVTLLLPLYAGVIPSSAPVFWAAFAGSSTLAGNVTLLGAASNLIVVEQAEKSGERIGFGSFLAVGLPLAIACLLVLAATLLPYVT